MSPPSPHYVAWLAELRTCIGQARELIDQLARELKSAFPDMRGFSQHSLKSMHARASAGPPLLLGATADASGRYSDDCKAGRMRSRTRASVPIGPDSYPLARDCRKSGAPPAARRYCRSSIVLSVRCAIRASRPLRPRARLSARSRKGVRYPAALSDLHAVATLAGWTAARCVSVS